MNELHKFQLICAIHSIDDMPTRTEFEFVIEPLQDPLKEVIGEAYWTQCVQKMKKAVLN